MRGRRPITSAVRAGRELHQGHWPVREFIFEVVAKFGRISKLIEAAPKARGVPIVLCMPKRCDIYVGPSAVLVFYLHKDSGPTVARRAVRDLCTLYSFISSRQS